MLPQKIVIEIRIEGDKCKSKALKIVIEERDEYHAIPTF